MYQEGKSWLYNVQYLGVEERDDTPVQLHLSRNLNDKTRVLKPERKIRTTFQGRHIYGIYIWTSFNLWNVQGEL